MKRDISKIKTASNIINYIKFLFEQIDGDYAILTCEKEKEMIDTGMHQAQIAYAIASISYDMIHQMRDEAVKSTMAKYDITINRKMSKEQKDIWTQTQLEANKQLHHNDFLMLKTNAQNLLFDTCKQSMQKNSNVLAKIGKTEDIEKIIAVFNSIHKYPTHVNTLIDICMKADLNVEITA
jgi:hypothetical protein